MLNTDEMPVARNRTPSATEHWEAYMSQPDVIKLTFVITENAAARAILAQGEV